MLGSAATGRRYRAELALDGGLALPRREIFHGEASGLRLTGRIDLRCHFAHSGEGQIQNRTGIQYLPVSLGSDIRKRARRGWIRMSRQP